MCGFIGFTTSDLSTTVAVEPLRAALATLRNRGPDGSGIFTRDWIGLGHARLAIIDPSDSAYQPMVDHSGRYVLVYNGEIYNYRELYDSHCADDPTVNGRSDTAVLLALYKRMGRGCLALLNGMFAFVIADLERRTLFMARDRFGEKPLYWRRAGTELLFGSEIRALRTLRSRLAWQVDAQSLSLFHTMGSIPPSRTIYEDVQALSPGHWLEVHGDGSILEGKYWSLEECAPPSLNHGSATYQEVCEETQSHLLRAVQSRMVSDVEVGLFLSGGFDSGALLGSLHALKKTPIRALCLDFQEQQFSEFAAAQITARAFQSPLHRHLITVEDFVKGLDVFFECMDQPTIDGFNTFFVCRAAKELGVKAWVSGIGGDELFGGYQSFRRMPRLKRLASVLQASKLSSTLDAIAPFLTNRPRLARALHLMDKGDRSIRAYQVCRNPLSWRNALVILAPTLKQRMQDILVEMDRHYPRTEHLADDFQRATVLEASMYMRALLLRDMDNFSTVHSIELRAPYLDHWLFEFVLGLPQRFKTQGGTTKPLLADSLPLPLPPEIRRQDKRGFTFPLRHWLNDHMATTFEAYVFDQGNRRFWDLDAVSSLWHTYRKWGVGGEVIWSLYVFSRWMNSQHESL